MLPACLPVTLDGQVSLTDCAPGDEAVALGTTYMTNLMSGNRIQSEAGNEQMSVSAILVFRLIIPSHIFPCVPSTPVSLKLADSLADVAG